MIDSHTHILPRMDDGSRSSEQSLAMLRAEAAQGVQTVVLTPHFYASREKLTDFLARREAAYLHLREIVDQQPDREKLPKLLLGAEVAWYPSLLQEEALRQLCIEGTDLLLIEPSMSRWDSSFVRRLYDLIGCFGVVPMIAHIDRYFSGQRPEDLQAIFSMEIPIQISAEAFTTFWTRKKALQAIVSGATMLMISDCHDMDKRPPDLTAARDVIVRKLGVEVLEAMDRETENLFE